MRKYTSLQRIIKKAWNYNKEAKEGEEKQKFNQLKLSKINF